MARSLNKKFFGPTSTVGSQIVASVKFDGGAAATGYIVKQVSARRYLFAKASDPSVTVKAKLVNTGTPTTIGTASITVSPYGGGTEYAMKITAKKVYTFDGNSYVWSAVAASATGQADIIADGERIETATATAVLATTGAILTVNITSGGTGYAVNDVLTVAGGTGSSATLTVSSESGGVITGVTISNGGTGYTVADPLTVTGPGNDDATFTVATLSKAVSTVTVVDGGGAYASAPTVTFSGGGGAGAAATAVLTNGVVTSFIVTNNGSGYTSAPTVTLSAP